MKREDIVPVSALVLLAFYKVKELLDKSGGEEAKELLDALQGLNYAAHVLADLVPEKECAEK